jgi:catechol 2,3-dioxygenase-like lactoylglutathione lyase family enzyme
MLDHITIGVSDLQRSRDFYLQALAPLGFDETNTWEVLPSEQVVEAVFHDSIVLPWVPSCSPSAPGLETEQRSTLSLDQSRRRSEQRPSRGTAEQKGTGTT